MLTRSEKQVLSHLLTHPKNRAYDFHLLALGIPLSVVRRMTLCKLLTRHVGGPRVGIYWTITSLGRRKLNGGAP